nr:D-amino-acid transaminase [Hyphomonadaceae bacterium]
MSRIAYVNGRYCPLAEATIAIEDRGLQFGDAVYEVWALRDGRLLDEEGHYQRLARSQAELGFPAPVPRGRVAAVVAETVRRNRLRDGLVYLQISRGTAPRDHVAPKGIAPNMIVTVRRKDWAGPDAAAARGISVITVPDNRWGRVDIKTVNLLPNTLAKQAALDAGAHDAWMVDRHGFITESTAQNAWIVTVDGTLVTRPLGHDILPGITRASVKAIAESLQVKVEERTFSVADAKAASEAFISSATSFVTPVIRIDGA